MTDIHFSDSTIIFIGLSGAVMMLLPIILFAVLKVKKNIPVKPVFVGAMIFVLFALVLKLPIAYLLYYADNPVAKEINSDPWLYFVIAGMLAGIFEESGRFIAYKTLLKKDRNRITSLSYGVGHGGIESLYIGIQMLSLIALALMVNSGGIAQITGELDPAQTAVAEEQIRQYAAFDGTYAVLGVVERASAICFHIAMSFLVFKAANDKKSLWLYPLAVFIHALIDFSIVFTKFDVPMYVFEIVFASVSALALFLSYKFVYKTVEPPEPQCADELPEQ